MIGVRCLRAVRFPYRDSSPLSRPGPAAGSEVPAAPQRRRRWGTSAVEFAVVGPVFLLMIMGIFEWGRCFMVQGLLSEAAREGCRKAVVEGTTTQQIKDAATNYLTNIGVSGDTASVIINDNTGNVTEAQNVPAFTEITVKVSVPFDTVTWLPVGVMVYLPTSQISVNAGPRVTLTGQCTLRRE